MLDLTADLRPDAIGGLTMAADPMAGAIAAVSHAEGRPVKGFMVRKAQKEHGTQRTVEGPITAGDRCVVIDDTVTTGGSLLRAIAAVEQLGASVLAVATLMDREEGAKAAFEGRGYPFRSAYTFKELGIEV
jgi:orotate phosphoribosyltransferase